jgi:hypothetical protein
MIGAGTIEAGEKLGVLITDAVGGVTIVGGTIDGSGDVCGVLAILPTELMLLRVLAVPDVTWPDGKYCDPTKLCLLLMTSP